MPNASRNTPRQVRIPDDLWRDLGRAAAAAGTDRATITRQLYAWYLHRPGVKQIVRPDPEVWREQEPDDDK